VVHSFSLPLRAVCLGCVNCIALGKQDMGYNGCMNAFCNQLTMFYLVVAGSNFTKSGGKLWTEMNW
jgi:hypothetical protein